MTLTQPWKLEGADGPDLLACEYKVNAQGRLATGSTELSAEGFQDALAAAQTVIESHLSSLSFQYDVPVEAVAWRVTEEKTGSVLIAAKFLGKSKLIDPSSTLHTTPATRELLSTWREAINAGTPMGQALGFYKIIERVHKYRIERESSTKNTRKPYSRPQEKMPASIRGVSADYKDAREAFSPYLGMRFTKVWNEKLRARVRNAIAHLLEDAPSLIPDRPGDLKSAVLRFLFCITWLMKC